MAWIERCMRRRSRGEATLPIGVNLLPGGMVPAHAVVLSAEDASHEFLPLSAVPLEQLQLRYALLMLLNKQVEGALPFLDLSGGGAPWRLGALLRESGHLVFPHLKVKVLERALVQSRTTVEQAASVTLDNAKATLSDDEGLTSPEESQCIFAQLFRQLKAVDPMKLRLPLDDRGRLFHINYQNEEGTDWGGVFREGLSAAVDDLFSARFALMVRVCPSSPTPNALARNACYPPPLTAWPRRARLRRPTPAAPPRRVVTPMSPTPRSWTRTWPWRCTSWSAN